MKPKITIIIPSYNQGHFLERTIKSAIEQEYPNLELFLLDGGSKDNSIEIIKKYSSCFSYWVSEKDGGQSNAINNGLRRATGEIINWLNSDDTILPGCLDEIANAFIRNPEVDVVYGDFVYIDSEDNIIRHRKLPNKYSYEKLLYHDYLGQPAVFFTKKIVDKVGLIDEELNFSMDWDFFLRLKRNGKFFHLNKEIATYRLHNESKTSEEGSERYQKAYERIYKKNKNNKFKNSILNNIYHNLYFIYSKFQRLFTIIYDNPYSYYKAFQLMYGDGLKGFKRFLHFRIKY